MKIDFLIGKMSGGGAERVVSLLANYLDDQGHAVRIITFQGTDNYPLNPSVKRIKLHSHPFFRSVVFNGFFSLLKFYGNKKNRPDVMSSHIHLLGYMTIPIAKIFNIKIIVSEHINHKLNQNRARNILRNHLYPYASAVTYLTSFDKDYYNQRNTNAKLLPNPSSFEINTELKVEKSKVVIAVGDLNRYHHKGFDTLLVIASRILKDYPDWKFKIVGAGEEGMRFLSEKAENLGIGDKVIFTGFRKDVQDLLQKSEIFILPSRFEGLPMTLLEAKSQGVCCIAFNCISGPSDVINDGEDGILIEDQNVEAMVSGLRSLIDDEPLRKRIAKNAPLSMESFSIETIGSKWISLLNEVTKEKFSKANVAQD